VRRCASFASVARLVLLPCITSTGPSNRNRLKVQSLREDPQLVPTDPIFYLAAIVAVTFLGLAKGGFAGVGLVATPLLSLVVPPVQAAAIVLPILLVQDAISAWVYRHDWDTWNLKVMLPGSIFGVGAAWMLAAYVSDGHVRLAVGLIALVFVLSYWLVPAPPRPVMLVVTESAPRSISTENSSALDEYMPIAATNLFKTPSELSRTA